MDGRIGNIKKNHNRENRDGATVLALESQIGIGVGASELGASRRVFSPGEIFCRCRLGPLVGQRRLVVGRYGHKGTLQRREGRLQRKNYGGFLRLLIAILLYG